MGRLVITIILVLLSLGCSISRETRRVSEQGINLRNYEKNYDTIRYFDSVFVRTFQTDSLREILRDRVILEERVQKEVRHDTLLYWQKDTIYVKEAKGKEETAWGTIWGWIISIALIIICVIVYWWTLRHM